GGNDQDARSTMPRPLLVAPTFVRAAPDGRRSPSLSHARRVRVRAHRMHRASIRLERRSPGASGKDSGQAESPRHLEGYRHGALESRAAFRSEEHTSELQSREKL